MRGRQYLHMIDIVIPLGDGSNGSRWEDNELKYSLRSLEKYARNFGKVFIVGARPRFKWQNLNHIPAKDRFGHERNIMEKFMIAANCPHVSDNFMMWNDDYFLRSEIDCAAYPNYYSSTIEHYMERRSRYDGYRISMENTARILKKQTLPRLMFDIHCPMIYNKQKFIEIMSRADWRVGNGYIVKSLYANSLRLEGEEMSDLKLHGTFTVAQLEAKTAGRHIFSISDKTINRDLRDFLSNLYPEKSKYEI